MATVAAVGLAGTAQAASLSIVDGTVGTIPGGGTNEALPGLGFDNPLGGEYSGQIEVTGSTTLRFRFHGREAGFNNVFTAYGGSFQNSSVANNTWSTSGFSSFDALVTSGQLAFTFTTPGGPDVSNGSNTASNPVNFFASLRDGRVYLFLDDDGAGPDDNHDDMVVSIEVVPLPASALLLLGGLGGIAALKRRRKAA